MRTEPPMCWRSPDPRSGDPSRSGVRSVNSRASYFATVYNTTTSVRLLMPDLDETALEGASTFLRLIVQALNAALDPGSYGELALHRISPFECLYDLTAKIVDIGHFLIYNGDDEHSSIVLCIPHEYLPLRLAMNIPSLWHAYKIFTLIDAYWTKFFVASYLLCWLFGKTYPLRSQQPTVAEADRIRRKITTPLFFALSHSLVCFAVFSDRLEAALWSWFGILVIAGLALFISPTSPQVNPERNLEFEATIQTFLQIGCLATLWLFQFSPFVMSLKVKDRDWRDSRMLMLIGVLQFDIAMVFLVAARTERWSMVRFGLVSASLVSMAYVYYIELYALTRGTFGLLA
ncbi:hypothetical protein M436DRAFT_64682 [Aureobasidium namibiae CBS 147.97]|uniref:Uncharacterized protein n=1 Tax=Aureobasidium namibiae CBS 147.97 TaxID=1043004 RepID=A0A074WHX0_9PEZI|nr:uncharacterized protein M436DRAFT_64682 [Aureobasidium namibiae CBS 147.97]KEQ72700.1 hypothetical protein M436DRAFT_64682 [Aureobasidium namibiae CBS 147.97]